MTNTKKQLSPREIVADLKEKYRDYDSASQSADFAYCDTAYETFNGNFDEFQKARYASADEALKEFQGAMTDALKNKAVVSLIKEERGPLVHYLPKPPEHGTTGQAVKHTCG